MARLKTVTIGGDRLARLLGVAREELATMESAQSDAIRIVISRVSFGAPVVSGTLAGSIGEQPANKPNVVCAGSSLVYAGVINYGWPKHNIRASRFANKALRVSRAPVEKSYADKANDILGKVRGA